MPSQAQRETPRHAEEQRVSHNHSSTSSSQVVIKPDITPKREEKQNHQPLRQRPQQEEPPISKARIKIVQQPLHARMCGFGEKDRRPIDPPPIIQLFLDDDPTYNLPRTPPKPIKPIKPRKKKGKKKGGKPGRKPGKKAQEAAAAAAAAEAEATAAAEAKKQEEEETKKKEERDEGMESDDEQENDDEPGSHDEDSDDEFHEEDDEDHKMGDNSIDESNPKDKSPRPAKKTTAERPEPQESTAERREPIKEPTPTPPPPPPAPKRRGRPPRDKSLAGTKHSRDNQNDSDSEVEWPRYEGGAEALRVDPLYVLHVSLWSEDGTEVRSMIATPGQTDPPKLTRILMGAVVVSPILLNDEHGNPGWYFSFPDLSIRTEGTYTLKFSLMRFASFDFDDRGGSHASTLIAEEISKPFSVYSAKKFPGMTESTELSKAFAKQGLKIPIRNDLRVRKSIEKE
ncbi:hypothetical protein BGZ80_002085 [Entomortierella chlamydospora]|uniref:Velvet domain-containing protein n=1 Tax=Entomortierella chlamydospora TaxID=101097 RepID=A0A9P6MQA4_9FUNG|nr:hypothetical protein BGZ79_009486 [Entomortierella chlamydospora]KAG0009770.1 hypothetical protein BGZ80_002085 [Entomortierella chlamydospora]